MSFKSLKSSAQFKIQKMIARGIERKKAAQLVRDSLENKLKRQKVTPRDLKKRPLPVKESYMTRAELEESIMTTLGKHFSGSHAAAVRKSLDKARAVAQRTVTATGTRRYGRQPLAGVSQETADKVLGHLGRREKQLGRAKAKMYATRGAAGAAVAGAGYMAGKREPKEEAVLDPNDRAWLEEQVFNEATDPAVKRRILGNVARSKNAREGSKFGKSKVSKGAKEGVIDLAKKVRQGKYNKFAGRAAAAAGASALVYMAGKKAMGRKKEKE